MVIVRPSNIYGPGQKPFRGQGFIATAIGSALKGSVVQVFGDGTHVRDYVYVSDFCTALKGVIEKGANGSVYNIGFGKGYTINEVAKKIGEVNAGLPSLQLNHLPQRPFDVHYNVLDHKKLTALTGWNPVVSLEEGLVHSANWITDYLRAEANA